MSSGKFHKPTSGICLGYKQANVALIPNHLASEFEKICRANPVPLPILQVVKNPVGIFKEVPKYLKIQNQVVTEHDTISENPEKYTGFLLGCSFSFEDLLLSNGIPVRNIEQKRNVSMFTTNMSLNIANPAYENTKMVVSLRPVPKHQLAEVYFLSKQLQDCHGAPIGIGYSGMKSLRIADLDNPDFGDSVVPEENDVPVFWCCGVTGVELVKKFSQINNSDTFFTHSPGHMYVSDLKVERVIPPTENPPFEIVEYFPGHYSVLSIETSSAINALDAYVTTHDPGNRGIQNFTVPGDFYKASLHLYSSSKRVLLTTGFPCNISQKVPYETDGLPGIQALAKCLKSLGYEVTVLVDELAFSLTKNTFETCSESYNIVTLQTVGDQEFDVILTSERTSRNKDSKTYKTMRLLEMDEKFIDPIDEFIKTWKNKAPMTNLVISIGDGGNEFGMGKLENEFCTAVDSCDFLIGAGVSNWACYALCIAIQNLYNDDDCHRYVNQGLTGKREKVSGFLDFGVCREHLTAHEKQGIRDGCKPDQLVSVDGMLFDQEHKCFIEKLNAEFVV